MEVASFIDNNDFIWAVKNGIDSEFKPVTVNWKKEKDGMVKLTPENLAVIQDVTSLDISGQDLTELSGVEWFTGLEYLNCGKNKQKKPADFRCTGEFRKNPAFCKETARLSGKAGCPKVDYNAKKHIILDDILDFHVRFETIHPFQDGNGRVGRLIMFKECLKHNIVPFIITEELKLFYYRGIKNWKEERGSLRDTCLTGQDATKATLDYFGIGYE